MSSVASINSTFFDLSENWHFPKQQHTNFFMYHTLFDFSASFYRKNKCLDALERYFIVKNSKNEKLNSNDLKTK
jgi:hypothetical protein